MNKITNTITAPLEELQKHNAMLQKENARLAEQVAELTNMVEWLKEQLRLNRKRQFASSSERTPSSEQLGIFKGADGAGHLGRSGRRRLP